jgi:rhomboid family GlyGly-CTERM serine protease
MKKIQPTRYEAQLKPISIRSYWTKLGWFLITLLVLLITTIFASLINPLLRFDRGGIYEGEIWRLFTGHFVHLGAYHALMNIIGLFLIRSIFPVSIDNKNLPKAILFIAVSISLALLLGSPQLDWYLGFSGVLHGLFAFCIVVHLTPRISIDWLILVALIFKVINEQLPGYDANYLMDYIHAPVAVDAHLYGALAGIIWGVLTRCRIISPH